MITRNIPTQTIDSLLDFIQECTEMTIHLFIKW